MSKFARLLPALFCIALFANGASGNAQADFGSVAVGASANATITVTVPVASSFTAVNVVTWGASGLDFTQAAGGTCATGVSYGAGQTCTVNVSFAPQYAGLRMGAVTLANPGNNIFAKTFIQGTGTAPQLVFLPGVATTAIYPTLNGYPLPPATSNSNRPGSLAVDGAGNLSIASPVLNSSGNNIAQSGFLELTSGSSVATLVPATGDNSGGDPGGNMLTPVSVRVDGAGDRILNDADHTISLPPGASVGAENTIYYLNAPAVDGKGNIYLFDGFGDDNTLEEYSAANFDGYVATRAACGVYSDDNGSDPQRYAYAQAVDAMGNVFLLNGGITEVTASALASGSTCYNSPAIPITENGNGYIGFNDLVFNAAGGILLSDYANNRVVEAPAGGGEIVPISPVVDGKGLNLPVSVALDHTGNLYIFDAGNSRVVKVDRTLQAPLSFATTPLGTASSDGVKAVVVKNVGTSAMTFSSIVFPADFPEQAGGTNACAISTALAPGASCNLNVTFFPQTGGALSESVVITDNNLNQSGTTQSFNVSGTGVSDALSFSATSLSFGSEAVGYSTAVQKVTLTNNGTAISFSSIALGGANATAFATSNTCGTTLAAGGTCSIAVRFAPSATGAATAAVVLRDNGPNSPQSIALSGTGITPPVASLTLSNSSLAYGLEPVGSSTATQNVMVTNTSSVVLYFKSIVLTGASATSFVTSNTCGASLAAGAVCRIGVRFLPNAAGAANASVTLTDNASTSPQSIAVSGTGVPLTLSASSISFGEQNVGSSSASKSVIVTNTSSVAVNFTSIVLTGPGSTSFTISNTCGASLAAGASCQAVISFAPSAKGSVTASATLSYNGSTSPQSVALSGTGVIPIYVGASSLAFGSEEVAYSTGTQYVSVSNGGSVPISFSSIALTGTGAGSYKTSNTCGASLAAGASCRIGVRFVPSTTGSFTGTVTLTDNATGSPQSISLSGTGINAPPASVSLSSSALQFGQETVGTSTATQNVTVTNTSSVVLYFNSIALAGTNAGSYVTSNTCAATLAAGASCRIGVRFVPVAAGPAAASINLTDNANSSPQTITLNGQGVSQ